MKQTIILSIMFFFTIALNADGEEINMVYKSGTPFNPDVAILESDTCVFSLSSGSVADEWALYIKTTYGVCKCLKKNISNDFTFSVGMCNIFWDDVVRYVEPGDSSTYYRGYVVCVKGTCEDTVNVSFNLAPSKPKVLKANLTYDWFDFETLSFVNPNVELFFAVEHFDNVNGSILYTETEAMLDLNEFIDKELFWGIQTEYTGVEEVKNNVFRHSHYGSWNQYMCFCLINKYGYSQNSDTIFTTDYITDQRILDSIAKYYTTGIESFVVKKDDVNITVCGSNVCMDSKVKTVTITNLSGQCMLRKNECDNIDISMLQSGIYVITLVTDTGEKYSKKIIL